MPKILPWRTRTYPCVDCGRSFLPPVGSQRSLVVRSGTVLCLECKAKREIAQTRQIIPCDHCGRRLARKNLLFGKSYKESLLVCPACYETQHDPFDEHIWEDWTHEDFDADYEAGYWW